MRESRGSPPAAVIGYRYWAWNKNQGHNITGDKIMDYTEVVRSINQAYWQVLMENDGEARASAAKVAEQMGFQPSAAETMIEQFSRQPLAEWLAQRSAASPSSV